MLKSNHEDFEGYPTINGDENVSVLQNPQTRSRITSFSRLANRTLLIGVFVVGVGEIFIAMVPQGAAAYVEAYKYLQDLNVPEVFNVVASTAIGISAHLGKFCLITYYNVDNLKEIHKTLLSPSWWRNLPSAIRKADYSDEAVGGYVVHFANQLFALVPGLTFGLLTKMIFPDFIKLVQETNPGVVFNGMAEAAKYDSVQAIFIGASFMSNLISSPKIMQYAWLLLNGLRDKDGQLLFQSDADGRTLYARDRKGVQRPLATIPGIRGNYQLLRSTGDKVRFTLATTAGTLLTGVVTAGFVNFFQIGSMISENYLLPELPIGNSIVRNLPSYAFGSSIMFFMTVLAFINGFPLGEKIINAVYDVLSGRYRPSSRDLLASVPKFVVAMVAVAICGLGGLPNVWQADDVHENPWLIGLAEAASAITEYLGTYAILMLLANYLFCCCLPKNNNEVDESVYEVIGNDEENAPRGDEEYEDQRPFVITGTSDDRRLISRCLPCLTFGDSARPDDAEVSFAANSQIRQYGAGDITEADVRRANLAFQTNTYFQDQLPSFWHNRAGKSGDPKVRHTFYPDENYSGLKTHLTNSGFTVKVKQVDGNNEMRINLSRDLRR